MGKYFKAEKKYFLATKMYIYYGAWIVSSILTTLIGRLQSKPQISNSTDATIYAIISLINMFLMLLSFMAPLLIMILFVQSITNVFTEGAYRNVFTLNISRLKWLTSKIVLYISLYFCAAIIIRVFNELIMLSYPQDEFVYRGVTSIFFYNNILVSFLILLVNASIILVFYGFATWLSVAFRKTVPVILILIFGVIGVQIVAAIIMMIFLSVTLGTGAPMQFLAYPLPGNLLGLTSLVYVSSDISLVYLNLGLTAVFQLAYAALFYFLGYRKINRLDF